MGVRGFFRKEDRLKEQRIINQTLQASDGERIVEELREINGSGDFGEPRVIKEIIQEETDKQISELKVQGAIENYFNKPIVRQKTQKILRSGHQNLTFKRWLKGKKKKLCKKQKRLIGSKSTHNITRENIKEFLKQKEVESDKLYSYNMIRLGQNLKSMRELVQREGRELTQKKIQKIKIPENYMKHFMKNLDCRKFDGLKTLDEERILKTVFKSQNSTGVSKGFLKTAIDETTSSSSEASFRNDLQKSVRNANDVLYDRSKTQRIYSMQNKSKFLGDQDQYKKKPVDDIQSKELQKVLDQITLLRENREKMLSHSKKKKISKINISCRSVNF